MSENSCQKLVDILVSDARSRNPTYPDQSLPALRSKRVRRALEERFAQGESLVGIEALPVHRETGLISVRFDFRGGAGVSLKTSAVLVVMNGSCEVLGLDPNHRALLSGQEAALPADVHEPFALATAGLPEEIDADTVAFIEAREQEFVQRRGLLSGLQAGSDDDNGDGRTDQDTYSVTAVTVASTCLRPFSGGFGGAPSLVIRVNDDQKAEPQFVSDDTLPAEDLGEILGGLF